MDLIIVGAGVSAMLLARSLIQRGCFRTLRLIGRPGVRAHRFSYWSDGTPTPFDAYTEKSWSTLRVVSREGRATRIPLRRFEYRTFAPARWFDELTREVLTAPGVVATEARADSIERAEDGGVVQAGGQTFEADWVFASARPASTAPSCWQRFEGWEVAVRTASLDLDAATLMDFRKPTAGDFSFVYALPLAPDRLFVEHVSYQPDHHDRHLVDYLNEVVGSCRWTLVDRERGATPLYLDPTDDGDRVRTIGVAGGVAKVTTGYALTRMWRDAEGIAEGLARRGQPDSDVVPRGLHRIADRFFVDLLIREPERLPELLEALFSEATGDAVLAFLDDQATSREQLTIARAMPDWLRWYWRRLLRM
jgi:lycopene beta-cyclase